MKGIKIKVGGAIETDAARRFIGAWRRASRGETFQERVLTFESWDFLSRVLTGKRMELLRYVHRHRVRSIRALARALGRDYSSIRADVQVLMIARLLDRENGGVHTSYDAIETRISI
jgi:predicted transcriptional regulator